MLLLLDHTSTQPDWNLAAEEYLLTSFTEPLLRIWRNGPSIIVGRHQNTWSEVNVPYVHQHRIPVVRRLSGGGAVFHDLGNINYSFIEPKIMGESSSGTFARCTRPILDALGHVGVGAYLSGRNDLLIDGKKFSGTAQCQREGRILLHGTLLYSSTLSHLSQALKAPKSKFSQKGVVSISSPVCNISDYLTEAPTVEQFMNFLSDYIRQHTSNATLYSYTTGDLQAIEALADKKYRSPLWNWGDEPHFTHQTDLKTDSGTWQIFYDTDNHGLISRIRIFGDAIDDFDIQVWENELTGAPVSHIDKNNEA